MTLCACGCGQATAIVKKTSTRDGTVRGQASRYVRGHHVGRGSAATTWKGGRSLTCGYVRLYRPDHPRACDGYVLEHIVIAEAALGKPLAVAHPVHHFDENRSNNENPNLIVCEDEPYHKLLHRRARALDACGHADWRQCRYCRLWAEPSELTIYAGKCKHVFHPACLRATRREKRAAVC